MVRLVVGRQWTSRSKREGEERGEGEGEGRGSSGEENNLSFDGRPRPPVRLSVLQSGWPLRDVQGRSICEGKSNKVLWQT